MVTVIFHGPIKDRFIARAEWAVNKIEQVFTALSVNFDGFDRWLSEAQAKGLAHKILVNGRELLDPEELSLFIPPGTVLTIIPVPMGSGAKGRLAVGVALVAASFFIPGGAVLAVGAAQISVASVALSVGFALATSGIGELLASTGEVEDDQSDLLGGIPQITTQGRAVPILLGERFLDRLLIISGAIDIEEVTPAAGIGGGKK